MARRLRRQIEPELQRVARTTAQSVYNMIVEGCEPSDTIPVQIMGPVMVACSFAAPSVMEAAGVQPTSELRSIMAAHLTSKVLEALSTLDHDEFDAFATAVMDAEQGAGPSRVIGPDGAPLPRPPGAR